MTKDSAAPTTATDPPPFPKACATESWTWASQLGSPVTAPLIAARHAAVGPVGGEQPENPHAAPQIGPDGSSAAHAQRPFSGGRARHPGSRDRPGRGHTRRPMAA